MARYYDYEAAAADMTSSQGPDFLKRWIQSLDKITGPLRKQAVDAVKSEAIDRYEGFPWQWSDHQRESQFMPNDEELRFERRQALGHGHVWAGHEGYDGPIDDYVRDLERERQRHRIWEEERAYLRAQRGV